MQLEVSGLYQHHGSAQVLRNVAFSVPGGTCVAVLGRNGAGVTEMDEAVAPFPVLEKMWGGAAAGSSCSPSPAP